MDNNFIESIRIIKKAQETDRLVIFVGAGVSMNSGLPSWWQIFETLKSSIHGLEKETDILKVPQIFYNHRGDREYYDLIKTLVHNERMHPNPIHQKIFDLNPFHIITTNYDNLLEKQSLISSNSYSVIRQDIDLPQTLGGNLIIKMHGDIALENIVLKENDFLSYHNDFPLIRSFIRSIFASKLVLFIGISFSDLNLKYILREVQDILSEKGNRPYLFHSGEKLENYQIEYLSKWNLSSIEYNGSIATHIKDNNGDNAPDSLADLGKELFNFLEFVRLFDPDRHNIQNLDVFEVLEIAFKKYEELTVVSWPSIMNSSEFIKTEFKKFSRYSTNPFIKCFDDHSIYGVLSNLDEDNTTEKFKETKYYKANRKRIQRVAERLHSMGIFYLDIYDQKPSQESRQINTYDLASNSKDDCSVCDYFNMDFLKAISRIPKLRLENSNSTEISIDSLEFPYLLFLIGDYDDCYYALKVLRQRAWKEKKLLIYFICEYNLHSLSRESYRYQMSEASYNELSQHVNNTNIEELLEKLAIPKHIKSEIRKLFSYRFVNELVVKTIENESKIRSDRYSEMERSTAIQSPFNPESKQNSTEVKQLLNSAIYLWNFTNGNFIFSEQFKEHKLFYWLVFQGLVTSYSIPSNVRPKIHEFSGFELILASFYCEKEKISILFRECKIKFFKLNSHGYEYILRAHQLLANFFKKKKAISPKKLERDSIQYFEKLILISKHVEFNLGDLDKVIEDYLSGFSHQYHTSSFEYFLGVYKTHFMVQLSIKTQMKVFRQVLQLVNNKLLHYPKDSSKFIDIILCSINILEEASPNPDKYINQIENCVSILLKIEDQGFLELKKHYLCSFFQHVSRELQDRIQQLLFPDFQDTTPFPFDLFSHASHHGVINPTQFWGNYLDGLEILTQQIAKTQNAQDDEMGLNHSFKQRLRQVSNLLDEFDLNINQDLESKLIESAPYWRFVRNPKDFDYSQFDFSWLWSLPNENRINIIQESDAFHQHFKTEYKHGNILPKYANVYFKHFY